MPGKVGSINIFDGADFGYWKACMQAYLESLDPKIWTVTHESDANANLL